MTKTDRPPKKDANLARRTAEVFFIPPDMSVLLSGVASLGVSLPPMYRSLSTAFGQNLIAVVHTVALPMTFASAAVQQSHWQRFHTAQRIRAEYSIEDGVADDPEVDAQREKFAAESATEKMGEFILSDDGTKIMANNTCTFLIETLREEQVRQSVAELLRQGTVLTWGAF